MKLALASLLTFLVMMPFAAATHQASAEDPFQDVCKGQARDSSVCKDKELNGANPFWGKGGIITDIINIISIIAGIAAVIIIIVAGLRFITGGNNPQEVQQARNLVIFAVIGLAVVAASQIIVRLFLSQL